MKKIKLICFDVDGTLVDANSWLVLTEGLGCSPQEHVDIYSRCKRGEMTFDEGARILTKKYQDSGKANESFIDDLFDKIEIKEEVEDLISYLKKKGYIIYLISSAIDKHVETVAKKLGVDGFYANSSLEFDNNGVLQRIKYYPDEGERKLRQLRELIKKLGISMDQVVFVGDSENDIEAFKATKRGIAVKAENEELKKAAWRTVDSLSKIKDII